MKLAAARTWVLENHKEDKSDYYFDHVFAVFAQAQTIDEGIAALLHDEVEDGFSTWQDIEQFELHPQLLEAVRLLTRGSESYREYIDRIAQSGNEVALAVKIYDIVDHLHPSRLVTLQETKMLRYLNGLHILVPALRNLQQST